MEELTENEHAWLVFLRMIALDRDPAPKRGMSLRFRQVIWL